MTTAIIVESSKPLFLQGHCQVKWIHHKLKSNNIPMPSALKNNLSNFSNWMMNYFVNKFSDVEYLLKPGAGLGGYNPSHPDKNGGWIRKTGLLPNYIGGMATQYRNIIF